VDDEVMTDAAERLLDLDGVVIEGDEDDDLDDELADGEPGSGEPGSDGPGNDLPDETAEARDSDETAGRDTDPDDQADGGEASDGGDAPGDLR
jgi:hypothetical protein